MSKYDGMAWYDPSEAERKALVAEKRKGREPAYAPTGSALKAGKLMKETEYAALMEKKAHQVTSSSPATTATASSLRGPRPSAVQPAAPQSNPAPAAPTMVAAATPAPAAAGRRTATGSAGKEAVLEVLGQGMSGTAEIVYDLRGLKCPLPVLRSRKKLAALKAGDVLTVETTDPLAVIDIAHMCNEDGHRLVETVAVDKGHRFRIVKGG